MISFETLESIRLYVGAKVHADRIAARNSRLNGYKQIALDHENQAAMGDLILRELANEYGEVNARQKTHDQGR